VVRLRSTASEAIAWIVLMKPRNRIAERRAAELPPKRTADSPSVFGANC